MKTKNFLLLVILVLVSAFSQAQHIKKDGTPDMRYKENKQTYSAPASTTNNNPDVQYQNGYVKTDGTVVKSHTKTRVNDTNTDNYSTKENLNPVTRQSGTRAKDYSNDAQETGKGKIIQSGSRGGQYYINSKGNKTYVPKRY